MARVPGLPGFARRLRRTDEEIRQLRLNSGGFGDGPFFLTATGRINSINSTAPTADYGVAAGRDCDATAVDAWAEGRETTASGEQAHAEGFATEASGETAHAEGSSTVASGDFSHAEGGSSTAAGDYSHAEGIGQANGQASHAEGRSVANGINSHAEGEACTTNGKDSHAEGNTTLTTGGWSHAEGISTWAFAEASHAEGSHAKASIYAEHAHSSTGLGQYSRLVVTKTTTSATPAELVTGQNDLGATSPVAVPAGETWMVAVEVAAHRTDVAGTVGLWRLAGGVSSSGGSLRLIGTSTAEVFADAGASSWDVDLAVSGSNLQVLVTGEAAKTILWVATIHATRIH